MPILRSPLNLQQAHQCGIPGLTVGNGHDILKHAINGSLKALIVEEPLSPRTSSSPWLPTQPLIFARRPLPIDNLRHLYHCAILSRTPSLQ